MLSYDISPAHLSPAHADPTLTNLQEENAKLQQEVGRLHKMIGWSFSLLTETQKNLVTAQNQIRTLYHRIEFDRTPVHSRRISSQTIAPSSEGRIRKVSRSLDSIQHELMLLEMDQQIFSDVSEPLHSRLSMGILNQKSPRLHAKTAKGGRK